MLVGILLVRANKRALEYCDEFVRLDVVRVSGEGEHELPATRSTRSGMTCSVPERTIVPKTQANVCSSDDGVNIQALMIVGIELAREFKSCALVPDSLAASLKRCRAVAQQRTLESGRGSS